MRIDGVGGSNRQLERRGGRRKDDGLRLVGRMRSSLVRRERSRFRDQSAVLVDLIRRRDRGDLETERSDVFPGKHFKAIGCLASSRQSVLRPLSGNFRKRIGRCPVIAEGIAIQLPLPVEGPFAAEPNRPVPT